MVVKEQVNGEGLPLTRSFALQGILGRPVLSYSLILASVLAMKIAAGSPREPYGFSGRWVDSLHYLVISSHSLKLKTLGRINTMAFAELVITGKGRSKKEKNPYSITLAVTGDVAKTTGLSMSLVLGPEVLIKHGLVIGEKLGIFFGTDEDKGKVLIKKSADEKGTSLLRYGKTDNPEDPIFGRLVKPVKPIEPIADFVNQVIKLHEAPFTWDDADGGIMVTLPMGFFAGDVDKCTAEDGEAGKKSGEATESEDDVHEA
jgi:hypothetical protein